MAFDLRGTRITVSFTFAAMACVMLLAAPPWFVALALSAALLHESGHVVCALLLHIHPQSITLGACGMEMRVDTTLTSFRRETALALAGPASNFICALCAALGYAAFQQEIWIVCAVTHIVTGVFNLLPVPGLDGGTALTCLLAPRIGREKTDKALLVTAVIFLFPLGAVGFSMFLRAQANITLLLTSIYICILLVAKKPR